MALVASDWTIGSTGDIRYVGTAHGVAGASYATVIELHRWLQDHADDAVASGDDILDITDSTPSARSTDNIIELIPPYNIDQTASEHLYDGSIIQAGGDDIWDGFVNYGNSGIDIQIIQNGAVVSNDFWNNTPHVTGVDDPRGLNPLAASGISHRFMLKVRTAGADIDGRRVVGISREFGKTYAEFNVAGTARGNNTLALSNSTDLNNQTPRATVATWTTITNVEGYQGIDINNDTIDEYYYSQWNRDTYSINQLYERTKWLTACETSLGGGAGTAATPNATGFYAIDANIFRGITHKISGTQATGTFSAVELVAWPTGTGTMVAVDSPTAGTKMWIQLLTGVAPVNTDVITGGTSGATFTASGSVSFTPSPEFLGQSTGSAIIGAHGVGVEKLDLAATDSVEALDGNKYSTPNYVTYTVSGLDSGETYVLVGPESGGTFDTAQLSVSGTYVGGETSFVVVEAIPSDTPASGTIRVWDGSTFARVEYTGWSGSTFTGCTGVPACTTGDDVWISYIDELASGTSAQFTSIFSATRPLYVRARDGGTVGATPIKTFESTSSLGSSGGSITVIKTADY